MTTNERDANEVERWEDVPAFQNEDEERRFWGEHSLSDALLDQMETGPGDPRLPPPRERTHGQARSITVRMDTDQLDRLRMAARERGIGYQTLLKQWINERLVIEQRHGGSLGAEYRMLSAEHTDAYTQAAEHFTSILAAAAGMSRAAAALLPPEKILPAMERFHEQVEDQMAAIRAAGSTRGHR